MEKKNTSILYSQQFNAGIPSLLVLVPTLSFFSWNSVLRVCPFLRHLSPVSISLHESVRIYIPYTAPLSPLPFSHMHCKALPVWDSETGWRRQCQQEDERWRWWILQWGSFYLLHFALSVIPPLWCPILIFSLLPLVAAAQQKTLTPNLISSRECCEETSLKKPFCSSVDLTVWFLCPSATCYSFPFSSSALSDMLPHPSPFSPPPLPLGWYVPGTKRTDWDGEREKRERRRGNWEKGEGVHLQESNFLSFTMCSRPAVALSHSNILPNVRKCALLASREKESTTASSALGDQRLRFKNSLRRNNRGTEL